MRRSSDNASRGIRFASAAYARSFEDTAPSSTLSSAIRRRDTPPRRRHDSHPAQTTLTVATATKNQVYGLTDLARGNVMFVATGVTGGSFLKGVRYVSGGAATHSIVMRSQTGTVREIETRHSFDKKPRSFSSFEARVSGARSIQEIQPQEVVRLVI